MKRFVRIRTKNYTARPLRRSILFDDWAIVRLGSRTPNNHCFKTPRKAIEINTIEAIDNSRDKLKMKSCFNSLKVPQAEWWTTDDYMNDRFVKSKLPYPIVIKRICGFQGRGMELINSEKEFNTWLSNHKNLSGWYFERFYNYSREYRLHVSSVSGVFLSWRKLRTKEATNRWFFNSTNSEWIGEDNEKFDKPFSWDKMKKAAEDAIKATKLDIGAVDIRVQSNKKEEDPKFIVCEVNSAPALGNVGIEKYKEEILKILQSKK
jgi:glutathione synthase/RimK-type ligase-like ATP-grasp enzyme